jgi:hypothetical protein
VRENETEPTLGAEPTAEAEIPVEAQASPETEGAAAGGGDPGAGEPSADEAVPADAGPAEPAPAAPPAGEAPAPGPPEPRIVEVRDLDWEAVRRAVSTPWDDARAEATIGRMEDRLAGGGPLGLAFEEHASGPDDRALWVSEDPEGDVWFVGDLHGDLLALEAALQHIDRAEGGERARVVFLGDLFDDGRHAPEVVLRVFELILERPHWRVTVVAGNHDVALREEDGRFTSSVLPSDFTDWLNAHPDHPWAARLGRLIEAFFARAPRAIFFPDGLLATHGGVPHTDLHAELEAGGDWNDPRVLQDFVWLRAHPRARRRIPNRTTRGSEFGREDFEAFCDLATRLERPVARLVRGHDHVEERFAVYPTYVRNPVLTVNTMSHRLPREVFGPYERVPVVARRVRGELPEVHRLFVPPELVRETYPEEGGGEGG